MSGGVFNPADRGRFDALVAEIIDALPEALQRLIEEVPVVVLDEPTPDMLRDLGIDPADSASLDEICGLHSGHMLTEQSIEATDHEPETIHLFRRGILSLAGGWLEREETDEEGTFLVGGPESIKEEIRVTLLHELGHHFGLDEGDLERLGYD